jgi:hypothetical protein
VKRRGPRISLEDTPATIRGEEEQAWLWCEELSNANSIEEMCEVCAAAHADMLASVHKLAGFRIGEGACSTAKPLPGFQKRHPETPWRQGCSARKPCQAATDHNDSVHA